MFHWLPPIRRYFIGRITLQVAVLFALFSLTTILFYIPNFGNHWGMIFRPAALRLLDLQSPYAVESFFNPPWGLIPLIPFALLPERLGNALLAAVSMWAIAYVAYRMGARQWIFVAFIAMPLTFFSGLNVNLDWLVAIGYLLPPVWGLPLVMLKPQLGIGIAFYWFIQAFKEGSIWQVIIIFTPVTALFIASFFIFGNYFEKSIGLIGYRSVGSAVTIPVACILLAAALRTKKPGLAIAASPFLTPYILPYSVPIALLGLMEYPALAIPAMLGLWIITIDPTILLINAPWLF